MKVFVAGLSKSGKTTCSLYATERDGKILYTSVSRVLREAGGIFPVQCLEDAMTNQQLATKTLSSLPQMKDHQIIDGHALIETSAGPLLVPDHFFDKLAPDLIIHIHESPELIFERRPSCPNAASPLEIAALASMEKSACERIAIRHGISFVSLASPSPETFYDEIKARLLSWRRP